MPDEAVGKGTQRISAHERSELIKNWFDILKAVAALILFGIILFLVSCDRERLKKMAEDMGVERVSGPGVEIALRSSSDALPRSQAALQQAQTQLITLQRQHSEAVDALRHLQRALGTTAISPQARQTVASILQSAPATLESTSRTTQVLSQAQTRTSGAIARLPGSGDSSLGYGVVFGADRTEREALDQLKRARDLPGSAKLFRRQGSYRSVVVLPTRDAAAAALPAIRAFNQYSADAYVVTLASWCPGADLTEVVVQCS